MKKIIVDGVAQTNHPMHGVWRQMINRCVSPTNHCYNNYGGRGIKVCARWRCSLSNFVKDMGARPFKGATIERKDNNGNYCPENCKWATLKEQSINKRTNRMVTINGRRQCGSAWADELGVPRARYGSRIRMGWDDVSALTLPKLPGGGAKISTDAVRQIRILLGSGQLTQVEIGHRFGLKQSAVSRIKTRSNWPKI